MFAAAVFSAWVLAAPNQSLDKTIKIFVIFSGSFSFLVIFQALILIFNPTLFHNVNYSPLGSLTSSMGDMKINSGLHYLGFWASGAVKVLGVSLMRFQSFASEPSILVTIFLIPGFLGLMYNGIYKKLGYLILFFSCILASAGTVYLALAFGATVYALSVFFGKVMTRNKDELIFYILIGISIAFLVLSIGFDIYKTTSLLDRGLRGYSEYSSILQYAGNKAEHRVFSSQEAFSLLINNPFGVGKASGISVVGIILDFGLKLGWFGVLISLLIFIPLIKRLIGQMSLPSTNKLAYAFLIGILIQALVFSGYGFSNPGGYVVIAVLIRISNNYNKQNIKGVNG